VKGFEQFVPEAACDERTEAGDGADAQRGAGAQVQMQAQAKVRVPGVPEAAPAEGDPGGYRGLLPGGDSQGALSSAADTSRMGCGV
jgi:hypothetical protein